ncbi:actin-crosslinking protein [Pseudovirgaria hyperparasitica]|uniref:Actin-crosslinking protein n=1 Tax=Pseudovirgaria hyperparasitica TaxID=470096 RepID=A0A6A6W7X1_9PEZI|nr:actin-crosslinking protein [Pseudovirgaria hyperparasitica]KAF2758635.1 actin-crosslinking protein [Pseudovirgaria hyperparasitica]
MVKPLTFKGDKKPRKRKRDPTPPPSEQHTQSLTTTTTTTSTTTDPQPSTTTTTTTNDNNDDTWTTAETEADITGPVLLVLATSPPTALSSDALGAVFAHPLENMIDSNPATAEPHDVRQVWVAGRVAGLEGVTLKGHHGKYLSADKHGLLSATSTAANPPCIFTPVPSAHAPSGFALQTAYETFLTAPSASEVRGDADTLTYPCTLRIRMQARFKPRLQQVAREEKASAKISRSELEKLAERKLGDEEVRRLKRARREGNFYEELVYVRRKGKHDKFA